MCYWKLNFRWEERNFLVIINNYRERESIEVLDDVTIVRRKLCEKKLFERWEGKELFVVFIYYDAAAAEELVCIYLLL